MASLAHITAFIHVVEHNSFAAAARARGVSTAAISRQVAQLEAALQVQLLHRTTRQVTVTEIGASYYQQCKKVLNELEEAEKAITGSQEMAIGTLHVISSRYFALEYIIPRLAEFMQLHPRLAINLELAERFPDLQTERLDLVFGMIMPGSLDLVCRQVSSTRYVLCAAPDYLKKWGIPKIPPDLSHHRYLTHTMRRPDNVLAFKDNQEIYIRPFLWVNDSLALRECAIQGMGIVRLHDYIVKEALRDGILVEILKDFQAPQQPIYLYYRQSKFLQPKIRCFIDFYFTSLNQKMAKNPRQ